MKHCQNTGQKQKIFTSNSSKTMTNNLVKKYGLKPCDILSWKDAKTKGRLIYVNILFRSSGSCLVSQMEIM